MIDEGEEDDVMSGEVEEYETDARLNKDGVRIA